MYSLSLLRIFPTVLLKNRNLSFSLALIVTAVSFSVADQQNILCMPESFFQGNSLTHFILPDTMIFFSKVIPCGIF